MDSGFAPNQATGKLAAISAVSCENFPSRQENKQIIEMFRGTVRYVLVLIPYFPADDGSNSYRNAY